jgi:hypothetical protein
MRSACSAGAMKAVFEEEDVLAPIRENFEANRND